MTTPITTAYETLLVELDGGTVTITLNRPERRNALTGRMAEEFLQALREINHSAEIGCVVVTGAGGGFCSGLDLSAQKDLFGDADRHWLYRMRAVGEMLVALIRLNQPTIAKVRGPAAGLGCNLALACDLVVAGEDARFAELFVKRGLSLDFGGSWLLPRLIGMQKAKELAFFGDVVDAPTALSLGLVNRVLPDGELDAFVEGWAATLAAGPSMALTQTKRNLNSAFEQTLEQSLDAESASQALNFGTDDLTEAMAAFAEKRDPVFRGR